MDINTWHSVLDVEDQQEIQDAADKALLMGQERFGEVILHLSNDVLLSADFSALVSALIVGNLAFQSAAAVTVELSDEITLTVRLDQS